MRVEMIARTKYLDELKANIDNEFIKVITGVRRSGKSVLMKQIRDVINHRADVTDEQIIYINFESLMFSDLANDFKVFYQYLVEKVNSKNKHYFFFDEIQLANDWQKVVNSLRVDFDCDIYLTGSNASILSGELATLLSGRYVQIQVFPFSFKEYLQVRQLAQPVSTTNMETALHDYMMYGAMPSVITTTTDTNQQLKFLSDIFDSIMLRDVSIRSSAKQVFLLRLIVLYLYGATSSEISVTTLQKRLQGSGFNISTTLLREYLSLIESAFLFYRVDQTQLRGKQRLRASAKYYSVDNGLWQSQVENNNSNLGNRLEAIVAVELLRRGYELKYGNVDQSEIDFVAIKNGKIAYFQVAYRLPENSDREIENLLKIADNHSKTLILGVDEGISDIKGIAIVSAAKWLLSSE